MMSEPESPTSVIPANALASIRSPLPPARIVMLKPLVVRVERLKPQIEVVPETM